MEILALQPVIQNLPVACEVGESYGTEPQSWWSVLTPCSQCQDGTGVPVGVQRIGEQVMAGGLGGKPTHLVAECFEQKQFHLIRDKVLQPTKASSLTLLFKSSHILFKSSSSYTLEMQLKRGCLIHTGLFPTWSQLCFLYSNHADLLRICPHHATEPLPVFSFLGSLYASHGIITCTLITLDSRFQTCVSHIHQFIPHLPQAVLPFLDSLVIPYFGKRLWSVEINSSKQLFRL